MNKETKEQLVNLIASGSEPIKTVKKSKGRGRPKEIYMLGGHELTVKQYNEIAAKAHAPARVMDEETFQTLARSAVPQLLDRAIKLAMVSDDHKYVLAVAKELADRGYGKAVQAVEVRNPKMDVRQAWKDFDEYVGPVIEAETVTQDDP